MNNHNQNDDDTNDFVLYRIWLNAFKCARPTDEFAAGLGREIIAAMLREPDRKLVLEVSAS